MGRVEFLACLLCFNFVYLQLSLAIKTEKKKILVLLLRTHLPMQLILNDLSECISDLMGKL